MKEVEIKKVKDAIAKHGDDFWNDEPEEKDAILVSNKDGLFTEILSFLKKEGLDLKIVKA
jgi:hypothetical protein